MSLADQLDEQFYLNL